MLNEITDLWISNFRRDLVQSWINDGMKPKEAVSLFFEIDDFDIGAENE
jgi:hypothetical protein